MLTALAIQAGIRLRRAAREITLSFLAQTPREKLLAIAVVVAMLVDFGIPLLALGCLSYGRCPVLHP